jgi:hypothetical protein
VNIGREAIVLEMGFSRPEQGDDHGLDSLALEWHDHTRANAHPRGERFRDGVIQLEGCGTLELHTSDRRRRDVRLPRLNPRSRWGALGLKPKNLLLARAGAGRVIGSLRRPVGHNGVRLNAHARTSAQQKTSRPCDREVVD